MNKIEYKGYTIALSNSAGGKAGRGHNKTATIQVREPAWGTDYLLLKQIRYSVGDRDGLHRAIEKAQAHIDGLPPRKRKEFILPELTDEELKRRAAFIRPIVRFDGRPHYIGKVHLRNITYTWNPKKLDPVPMDTLKPYGEFKCLHRYGSPMLFKPSVAEVLCQIPGGMVNFVRAFEMVRSPETASDMNLEERATQAGFHVSTIRLYTEAA